MKKIIVLAMVLSMALMAAGCGNKEGHNVKDHIKLGQYKGIQVTVDRTEVTDEKIDEAIRYDMEAYAVDREVTDRPVQAGDTVNIDFEGLKDGVAFEGGAAAGYDLKIGSGQFIPGFEEGLIGHELGEKVSLNLSFPEEYHNAELAGQAVVFNVTINSITEAVIPELTEEFVKSNTKYDSIAAYREGIRAELAAQYEEEANIKKSDDVFNAILNNSEIISLPQVLLDYYKEDYKKIFTQYAQQYGLDFDTFLAAINMSQADYEKQAAQFAETSATQELVLSAIIEAEKIALTDQEFNAEVEEILQISGYPSRNELYKVLPESRIRKNLLMQKAIEFVMEQAIEV